MKHKKIKKKEEKVARKLRQLSQVARVEISHPPQDRITVWLDGICGGGLHFYGKEKRDYHGILSKLIGKMCKHSYEEGERMGNRQGRTDMKVEMKRKVKDLLRELPNKFVEEL